MARIRRFEFKGSGVLFWLMCLSIICIPLAVLYLIDWTIVIDEEVDDPQGFVKAFRPGEIGRKGT